MAARLQALLQQHRPPLRLIPQPADGDCLIHSLKHQCSDPHQPVVIRRQVADYVWNNFNSVSRLRVALAGKDVREWCRLVVKEGEWLETDFALCYCQMHNFAPPNFFHVGSNGQLLSDRPFSEREINLGHASSHYQPVELDISAQRAVPSTSAATYAATYGGYTPVIPVYAAPPAVPSYAPFSPTVRPLSPPPYAKRPSYSAPAPYPFATAVPYSPTPVWSYSTPSYMPFTPSYI
eukprot:TRINITY_DN42587_c0_g1_i1.p1 TRINITY_DN42587_c0_g1~~TRINITY_DN42587_c0_g1_i1.p1  ORF type:complete len:244 (+),score=20.46 TRINITY_DN42587_c0_g1_i1:28-732(+)